MEEYTRGLLFIGLGIIGSSLHWVKKRYIDRTTTLSFFEFQKSDPKHTILALSGVVAAEIPLSLASTGFIHLNELAGAISAGYMADSTFNKASE